MVQRQLGVANAIIEAARQAYNGCGVMTPCER